jgi:hypothetical protein
MKLLTQAGHGDRRSVCDFLPPKGVPTLSEKESSRRRMCYSPYGCVLCAPQFLHACHRHWPRPPAHLAPVGCTRRIKRFATPNYAPIICAMHIFLSLSLARRSLCLQRRRSSALATVCAAAAVRILQNACSHTRSPTLWPGLTRRRMPTR